MWKMREREELGLISQHAVVGGHALSKNGDILGFFCATLSTRPPLDVSVGREEKGGSEPSEPET